KLQIANRRRYAEGKRILCHSGLSICNLQSPPEPRATALSLGVATPYLLLIAPPEPSNVDIARQQLHLGDGHVVELVRPRALRKPSLDPLGFDTCEFRRADEWRAIRLIANVAVGSQVSVARRAGRGAEQGNVEYVGFLRIGVGG